MGGGAGGGCIGGAAGGFGGGGHETTRMGAHITSILSVGIARSVWICTSQSDPLPSPDKVIEWLVNPTRLHPVVSLTIFIFGEVSIGHATTTCIFLELTLLHPSMTTFRR